MTKIMIVEDSNFMVSVIRNFVKKKEADVEFIEAHNGKEAVEKYPIERPDLVFMDIMMPEMDGMTALEKIKGIDMNAKVVMVTSLKDPAQEDKAKAAGALMYIKKPFNSADIFNVLDTVL